MAVMRRVDEQLRFLQQLYRAVKISGFARADKLFRLEQVFSELAAGVLVPEQLCIVKTPGKFHDDLMLIL
jgi:hypothetical protein